MQIQSTPNLQNYRQNSNKNINFKAKYFTPEQIYEGSTALENLGSAYQRQSLISTISGYFSLEPVKKAMIEKGIITAEMAAREDFSNLYPNKTEKKLLEDKLNALRAIFNPLLNSIGFSAA